jgi:hypothetical protein
VLDFVFRPLRSVLDVGERVISKPLEQPEHELTVTVDAIHRVADSIEHHVEVIEGLATSVEPLKESVNNLNATMIDLVSLMAPMGSAEHGVQHVEHGVKDAEHGMHRVERFFGFRRHARTTEPGTIPATQPGPEQLPRDGAVEQPDDPT